MFASATMRAPSEASTRPSGRPPVRTQSSTSPPGTLTRRTHPSAHPVYSHPPAASNARSSGPGRRPSPTRSLRCSARRSCRGADTSGPYEYSGGIGAGEKSLGLYSTTASTTGASTSATAFKKPSPAAMVLRVASKLAPHNKHNTHGDDDRPPAPEVRGVVTPVCVLDTIRYATSSLFASAWPGLGESGHKRV